MSIYFYCRISTATQNLARQVAVAKNYTNIPDENVFCDKASGATFERTEYKRLQSIVVSGDEVVVKELDRLGRDKEEIKNQIAWFKSAGVTLRILDVPTTLIDFQGQEWLRDMVNNILIEVLGAVAEQEREKTLRRQREGIEAMPIVDGKHYSVKKNNFHGRPRITTAHFQEYLQRQQKGEITVVQCCAEMGISISLWYRRKAEATPPKNL